MHAGRAALGALLAVVALLASSPPGQGAPAGQLDDSIVLQVTSPAPGQRLRGRVEIAGYAADRRAQAGSGLNERDVAIYLNDPAAERNLFHYADAGRPSPEAVAALGPSFEPSGFLAAWETCSFAPGPYRLYIWVSSLVVPGARQMASVDVEVEPCPPGEVLLRQPLAGEAGRVQLDRPGPRAAAWLPAVRADFAAAVDARCLEADLDCRYWLNFRELPGPGGVRTDAAYHFEVDAPRGSFALAYRDAGEPGRPAEMLVRPTLSDAVRRGTATNRLGVLAEGDRLRLYVNGEEVADVRHDRRPWGQLAWGASTRAADRPVQVQFANLAISTPGPLDALEAVLRGR